MRNDESHDCIFFFSAPNYRERSSHYGSFFGTKKSNNNKIVPLSLSTGTVRYYTVRGGKIPKWLVNVLIYDTGRK